jgi:hypothetical protein
MTGIPVPPPFVPQPYQRVGVEPEIPPEPFEPPPGPITNVVIERPAPKPRKPIQRKAPAPPPPPEPKPTLSPEDLAYKAKSVRNYLTGLNATERRRIIEELGKS